MPATAEEREIVANKQATEIKRSNLQLGKSIGQGAFGDVCLGELKTKNSSTKVRVACKTLKPGAIDDDKEALLAEAALVSGFDHPNVVSCLGQISIGDPKIIIFEFMAHGSLLGWLEEHGANAALKTKLKMAIDIARGMQYLSNLRYVHRDLASRNVLVSDKMVCKISDFGLSRDLKDEMYYQSEGGMVPIRWTPPEAYKYKKYSSASDVWSYGVTLYEIFTNAQLPYSKGWSNLNVMVEVERGYRLPPPAGCPRAIYKVMMQSWNPHRRARPNFNSLTEQMELAYDMLFPAETDEQPSVDPEDCTDLHHVYMGVPVPDLSNLDLHGDLYLAPNMDLKSSGPVMPPQVPERASIKRENKNAENRLSAYEYSDDGLTAQLRTRAADVAPGDGDSEDGPNLRTSYATRKGSFRKQRELGNDDEGNASGTAIVDYVSNKAVEEVLRLARERENISRAESEGISKMDPTGQSFKARPKYIEQVGRATDVRATAAIKGRGQCKCRRFKCVCKLD